MLKRCHSRLQSSHIADMRYCNNRCNSCKGLCAISNTPLHLSSVKHFLCSLQREPPMSRTSICRFLPRQTSSHSKSPVTTSNEHWWPRQYTPSTLQLQDIASAYFLTRFCSHNSLTGFPNKGTVLDPDSIPGTISRKEWFEQPGSAFLSDSCLPEH